MEQNDWDKFDGEKLTGRNRRLLNEWITLDKTLSARDDIDYEIIRSNEQGLPVEYVISYHIRSICGVDKVEQLNQQGIQNPPQFHSEFLLHISIPRNYPSIDAPVDYRFLLTNSQNEPIPHPWHPNIRYFGEFAGRVCINALNTFSSIAWSVERVALYLRYELYHAWQEPPYPEDIKVAQWVIKQGEPNEWIFFDQED